MPWDRIVAAALLVAILAGCGGSGSDPLAEREAEKAASTYAEAIYRSDFHTVCAVQFTGPRRYGGATEADRKRECEHGWRTESPYLNRAPEPQATREVFGLSKAIPRIAEISGKQAQVDLRDPETHEFRIAQVHEVHGRWMVLEDGGEEERFFGP